MDWLATFGFPSLPKPLVLLWMAFPALHVWQAVGGLWRRWRLRTRSVKVDAEVAEVRTNGEVDPIAGAMIVDLALVYEMDGQDWGHLVTRHDHHKQSYQEGDVISLICERGNPANVMDAQRRPWDDVMGPMVFALLLFAFMGWLALVTVGWY